MIILFEGEQAENGDAVTTEPTPATGTRRVSLDYIAALPSSRISRTPAFQNGIGKELKAC